MLSEIGSEFYEVKLNENILNNMNKYKFALSGRTAINIIIRDLKSIKNFKSIYLPSYCCDSMIYPFIDEGIKVFFYDVYLDEKYEFKFDIDDNLELNAILLINYFGFQNKNVVEIAKKCKEKDMIIIEDLTHSLFTPDLCSKYVDYKFASLRKWTALYSGALAIKTNGEFIIPFVEKTNTLFSSLRKDGMDKKFSFLQYGFGDKAKYLEILNQAEDVLKFDYRNYGMDSDSLEILSKLDIEIIKKTRIKNAVKLLSSINKLKYIIPIYNDVKEGDVPLFIPIIVKYGLREKLRKYLIENDIYCPVHWPISEYHIISKKSKFIYDNILSIVCDQRYSEDELDRLIYVLKKFEGELHEFKSN